MSLHEIKQEFKNKAGHIYWLAYSQKKEMFTITKQNGDIPVLNFETLLEAEEMCVILGGERWK